PRRRDPAPGTPARLTGPAWRRCGSSPGTPAFRGEGPRRPQARRARRGADRRASCQKALRRDPGPGQAHQGWQAIRLQLLEPDEGRAVAAPGAGNRLDRNAVAEIVLILGVELQHDPWLGIVQGAEDLLAHPERSHVEVRRLMGFRHGERDPPYVVAAEHGP